ncbi:CpsD/CapB family tyrosine-protein kinase [Desulforhopalus sp. IMCC35007]|uniref:CpsD/CapB family tyrosine-protein kinase n=1 Tax=Desulforhopalus sp. IMCC35007 TaxID=2569543 RepID=UPI0010AE59B5|nr:CpsD/CapB family tyrosine-protein kinase [Desulforhopalus sp. IMCC35007]TKB12206.1 CpsD/CapB family tyrosine-protein kinase [Desulforhopalus sp. IMCC35007]
MLEKSGYSTDLDAFVEPDDVKFDAVEDSIALAKKDTVHYARADSLHGYPLPRVPGEGQNNHPEVFCSAQKLSESFRLLCSKIFEPANNKNIPRSIMITSVAPGEGRSYVAANIGMSLAQHIDQELLFIDCDLRRSSLANVIGVTAEAGVSDYLLYKGELSALIQQTPVEKVGILPAGTPPDNASELLGSVRIHDLVEELAASYPDRCFIFDTPPMEVVPESYVLSQAVDGVVLVVCPERSDEVRLQQVISDIGAHKILGIISRDDGGADCQSQSSFSFQELP